MNGTVLKFAVRRERTILLVVLLAAVPLVRMISERATRIKAGGLTAVGQRPAMGDLRLVDGQGHPWRIEGHRAGGASARMFPTTRASDRPMTHQIRVCRR